MRKSKKKYVVISVIGLFVLIAVLLLQIFMYGRILPGPREPGNRRLSKAAVLMPKKPTPKSKIFKLL